MQRPPHKRPSGPKIRTDTGEWVTPLAFIHPCQAEKCPKEGSFGFKVNLRRNQPGVWYCMEHRHMGEALYVSSTPQAQDVVKGETDDKSAPVNDLPDGA